MIDWTSDESHLLLNPRLPPPERKRLELLATAAVLPAHIWIGTSGTSGALKLTALSRRALLASAAAVNEHLDVQRGEVWCCVLPTFHVGGLGIHARAWLTGSKVVTLDWNAIAFARVCAEERVSFSALVPAQVSDLVREEVRAPSSLRAVIVGGGAAAQSLMASARSLGWPLLQSYGMTECCSQIATASRPDSGELQLLSHLEARAEEDGRLAFRGSSLLTGYAQFDGRGEAQFIDPKVDGWFISEDLGELEGRVLRVEGRHSDFVKVGGESVDLKRLDRIVDEIVNEIGGDAAVFAVEDERLGHVIHLAVTADILASAFAARVLPFERPRVVHKVPGIPRSPLGKLLRRKLREDLVPGSA